MLQVGPHVRPHTSFGAVLGTPSFDHFVAIFDTEKLGGTGSATKTLLLPFTAGYEVHWGDGVINSLNTHTYSTGGEWTVEIFEPVTTFAFQGGGDCLKLVDMVSLGIGFEINTTGTWQGCRNMVYSTTDTPDIITTDLTSTFNAAELMNGNIGNWDVSAVTNMTNMFFGAFLYTGAGIASWDVSSVESFSQFAFAAHNFSEEIDVWNMISCTNIGGMFRSANNFNVNVNGWGATTANIQQMNHVFNGTNFTHDLPDWDVGSVNTTHAMFGSTDYNGDISSWELTSATDTSWMFAGNNTFNNQVGDGNFPLVTNMSNMFGGASSYNQNMGGWLVPNVTNMATMLDNSGLSTTNYNAWLVGLDGQTLQTNIPMGAQGLVHSGAGSTARASLIIAPAFMTISGDST
jgi:hypothetical protein